MNKQKRQLIIISLVLVVLLAIWALAAWLPSLFHSDETTAETTVPEAASIINIKAEDADSIEIVNESGIIKLIPETVAKQENDEENPATGAAAQEIIWKLAGTAENPSLPYDIDRLTLLASGLLNLQVLRDIETNVEDASKYGIDKDSAVVVINEKNGSRHEIVFGDELASGAGTYATLLNSGRICSVSAATAQEVRESLLFWLDKSAAIGVSYNDLTHFVLNRSRDNLSLDVECQYNGDPENPEKKSLSFQIISPIRKEGRNSTLGKLVEQITDLQVTEYVEIEPADLSIYGLDQPAYEFDLTTSDTTVKVYIGDQADSESVFVMSSLTNAVMKAPVSELDSLDTPLLELADPFISLYSMSEIEKIQVMIEDTEFTAEISVDDKMTASDESSEFFLDGRDAKIFSQDNEILFVNLYQSITGITIEGMDLQAKPENNHKSQLVFHLKSDQSTGESAKIRTVEFVRRDDYTDYVFIDGRYAGYYVDSAAVSAPEDNNGKDIISAYKNMVYAIDNAVDGVFDTREGYQ